MGRTFGKCVAVVSGVRDVAQKRKAWINMFGFFLQAETERHHIKQDQPRRLHCCRVCSRVRLIQVKQWVGISVMSIIFDYPNRACRACWGTKAREATKQINLNLLLLNRTQSKRDRERERESEREPMWPLNHMKRGHTLKKQRVPCKERGLEILKARKSKIRSLRWRAYHRNQSDLVL